MLTIDVANLQGVETENHTSKGNQPKWRVDKSWIKADYMGYEALAEIVISRLLAKDLKGVVCYEPVLLQGCTARNGCMSRDFLRPDEDLIPIEKLYRAYEGRSLVDVITRLETEDKIKTTVDFVNRVTGLNNFGAYLTRMMEIDAFFLNEDRHMNNIAVIRSTKTKTYRLCPIFDNGLSLLSDTYDHPLDGDMYEQIDSLWAKPFDRSFLEQMSAAEHLYGQQIRFTFTKKDVMKALEVYDFEEAISREDVSESADLAKMYGVEIRRRAENVIFEQMRKYRNFFPI